MRASTSRRSIPPASRPPGARVRQEARRILSSGRTVVGRFVEQQVASLRQGRADLQPAERLGRRQARRAPDSGEVLDAWLPEGAGGPVQSDPSAFLRRMEFLEEQAGG